jgi:phosphotransferase system HPr-like phosphotransfer protein
MRSPCSPNCAMPLFSFFTPISYFCFLTVKVPNSHLTFLQKHSTIFLDNVQRLFFKEVFLLKTVQISLNSISKVKSFVNAISQFDYDFDLISGRYVIDAKSIMGIFSLDLSKPIDLAIHTENSLDDIMEVLKPYIIE